MDEAQTVIKIAGSNISNLRYTDNTTVKAESEEELKSLLIKVKEESEKADSKLNIQKTKTWHLVPSLHGKQMGKQCKQWEILFSWTPDSLQMVTEAMKLKDTCSLEEKLWEPRQHIKSRDVTLPTKVHLVKVMVFPVVMYERESWTLRKAEHRRIDAFELWCWRRLLRVPWPARRSNQSTLKEISPEYSLEGLMLKLNSNILATWCEELTHWKRPWC